MLAIFSFLLIKKNVTEAEKNIEFLLITFSCRAVLGLLERPEQKIKKAGELSAKSSWTRAQHREKKKLCL